MVRIVSLIEEYPDGKGLGDAVLALYRAGVTAVLSPGDVGGAESLDVYLDADDPDDDGVTSFLGMLAEEAPAYVVSDVITADGLNVIHGPCRSKPDAGGIMREALARIADIGHRDGMSIAREIARGALGEVGEGGDR